SRSRRHMAHEDVLGDGEFVEHHRLLVDGGDAGRPGVARREEIPGLSADADFPLVGTVDAGQYLDYRRLAGAVLADDRRDPAGLEREAYLAQRPDAGKALGNAGKGEDGIRHGFPAGLLHGLYAIKKAER